MSHDIANKSPTLVDLITLVTQEAKPTLPHSTLEDLPTPALGLEDISPSTNSIEYRSTGRQRISSRQIPLVGTGIVTPPLHIPLLSSPYFGGLQTLDLLCMSVFLTTKDSMDDLHVVFQVRVIVCHVAFFW